jgi:hypothetical protein
MRLKNPPLIRDRNRTESAFPEKIEVSTDAPLIPQVLDDFKADQPVKSLIDFVAFNIKLQKPAIPYSQSRLPLFKRFPVLLPDIDPNALRHPVGQQER